MSEPTKPQTGCVCGGTGKRSYGGLIDDCPYCRQTDEPASAPVPSEPPIIELEASAPVAGESDRPHYPASYDDGVWYCDAHGTFGCRECAARYEDANEWPPPVAGERIITHVAVSGTGVAPEHGNLTSAARWAHAIGQQPVAPVAEKTEAEPCRARFGVDRLSDDEIEFLLSIAASGHVYTAAEMQRHDAIRERWGDMSRAWYSTAIVFRAAIAERDRKIAEMQSTIEAQAREIEANAALREEIAELIAELKKQKRG